MLLGLFLPMARGMGAQPAVRAMHIGDSDVLEFDGITAAATGDPAVADIVPLSTHRLLVNAKGEGRTTVTVMDRRGKHQVPVSVAALGGSLPGLAAQIQADIGLASVSARAIRGVILLEGAVPTEAASQRAETIADIYAPKVKNLLTVTPDKPAQSPAAIYAALINETWAKQGIKAQVVDTQTIALTGTYTVPVESSGAASGEPPMTDDLAGAGEAKPSTRHYARTGTTNGLDRMLATLPAAVSVVNLVQTGVRPARQILVRAKVIDIQRDAIKELGIRWGTLAANTSRAGNGYVLQSQPILFGQSLQYLSNNSLSGGGPLRRLQSLAAALSALITENKARVLSEPSILVRDGAEGSILVGGEIPVPVAQTNNGYAGATVSVEYKPYGVRLYVQPTVVESGTIELLTTPEVSDLDYGNGVQFNGLSIPALTIRRAASTLQMQDGETLVIGGLYSNSAQRQVERIPLLSQIPVLGEFFKYTATRKRESELLILLSVEIVRPDSPDVQPPAPGSTENLPIGKPDVPRRAFDSDFPDLDNRTRFDKDQPKTPVNLPPVPDKGGP